MIPGSPTHTERKGTIAPLAAFSLIFVIGMVAFAVDVSWMVSTETELQNAADAAALAAAAALPNYYVQYNLPNLTSGQKATVLASAKTAAQTAATNCAARNGAGGKTTLNIDTTNDIEFGFTDSSLNYSTTYTFPNSVTVTVRRASTSNSTNGALSMFFAPVIGTSNVNLKASATATMYGGTMNSLKGPANVLPITYDYQFWDTFLSTGQDPQGLQTIGSDGLPQLVIYDGNNENSPAEKGNFGLLSLDDSHNGTSEIRSWIQNGLTNNDVTNLTNNGLIPLSSHNANSWDWNGDNGFRSSVVSDINTLTGNTYILPLYKAYNSSSTEYQSGNGQGSNFNYNIVRFVGVKIVSDPTDNRKVTVQPAAVSDSDFVFTNLSPVGSGSTTLTTTFTITKLTR